MSGDRHRWFSIATLICLICLISPVLSIQLVVTSTASSNQSSSVVISPTLVVTLMDDASVAVISTSSLTLLPFLSSVDTARGCILNGRTRYDSGANAAAQWTLNDLSLTCTPAGPPVVIQFSVTNIDDITYTTTTSIQLSACQPGQQSASLRCDSCTFGQYSDFDTELQCTLCQSGRYADTIGMSSCILCALGSSSPLLGRTTECLACDPGLYANVTGMTTCPECETGKFSVKNGTKGAVWCRPCAIGFYTSVTGRSECQPCPVGRYAATNSSSLCDPCEEGSFQNTTGGSSCFECAIGDYIDVTGQADCNACQLGKFGNETHQMVCDDCPAGYIAAATGLTTCTACANGVASLATAQSQCIQCPPGAFASGLGSSICSQCDDFATSNSNRDGCQCKSNYYLNPFTVACEECPIGADCSNALSSVDWYIAPLPGYYAPFNMYATDGTLLAPVEMFECLYEDACPGGANTTSTSVSSYTSSASPCATGYKGYLCSICEAGYGRNTKYQCGKCPNSTLHQLGFVLGSVALVVGVGVLTWMSWRSRGRPRETHSVLVKVLLSSIQVNSMASRFAFKWPNSIQTFLDAQDYVGTAGTSWLSFDCFFPDDDDIRPFYLTGLIMTLLPILMVVLPWPILKAIDALRVRFVPDPTQPDGKSRAWTSEQFRTRYQMAEVMGLFLMLPDITLQTFKMFVCQRVGITSDDEYLVADMREKCYSRHHVGWILGTAMPSLVMWVIASPLVAFLLLHREISNARAQAAAEKPVQQYHRRNQSSTEMSILTPTPAPSKLYSPPPSTPATPATPAILSSTPSSGPPSSSVLAGHRIITSSGREESSVPLELQLLSPRSEAHRVMMDDNERVEKIMRETSSFSFLFKGYKVDRWFWESVVIFRKVSMVAIVVFSTLRGSDVVEVQSLMALFLLTFCMIAHVYAKPYKSPLIDKAEFTSLLVSWMTMFLAQFLFRDILGSDSRTGISFIIVIMNLMFIVGMLLLIWRAMHQNLMRRVQAKRATQTEITKTIDDAKGMGQLKATPPGRTDIYSPKQALAQPHIAFQQLPPHLRVDISDIGAHTPAGKPTSEAVEPMSPISQHDAQAIVITDTISPPPSTIRHSRSTLAIPVVAMESPKRSIKIQAGSQDM